MIICQISLFLTWVSASPPPEVDVEIEETPTHQNKTAEAKEKEAIDGVFDPQPPVGILKKNDFVSGQEVASAPVDEGKGAKKRKTREKRRKLVPVWKLVN